jgi:hypothetical protein
MSEDARLAGARAILGRAGFGNAEVTSAGHDASIAVIAGLAPGDLEALAALAPAIKALGFHYLTLDITEPQP